MWIGLYCIIQRASSILRCSENDGISVKWVATFLLPCARGSIEWYITNLIVILATAVVPTAATAMTFSRFWCTAIFTSQLSTTKMKWKAKRLISQPVSQSVSQWASELYCGKKASLSIRRTENMMHKKMHSTSCYCWLLDKRTLKPEMVPSTDNQHHCRNRLFRAVVYYGVCAIKWFDWAAWVEWAIFVHSYAMR